MKNHEGYYDPTAGKAIRRAQKEKVRWGKRKAQPLMYQIGELPELPEFPMMLK